MGSRPVGDGQWEELAEIFDRRYPTMVRLASWLVGDGAAAEDLVQDAFVRLARADLGRVGSVDAYLRTIVVNVCRSHRRRLGMRRVAGRAGREEEGIEPGPETLLADEEVTRAVAALPRRQRECVVLRFTDDLAVADIATALGISEGSVKTHIHRGLAALDATLHPNRAPAATVPPPAPGLRRDGEPDPRPAAEPDPTAVTT